MLLNPTGENGSDSLLESYDESLADTVATLALSDPKSIEHGDLFERVLSLRMGAAFLAQRDRTAPPAHLGAYAIDKIRLAAHPSKTLRNARTLALASVLVQSLGQPFLPRWAESIKSSKTEMDLARASAAKAYAHLLESRNKEADEDFYLSARAPALFIMDLDNAPERKNLQRSAGEALERWRKMFFIPSMPPPQTR